MVSVGLEYLQYCDSDQWDHWMPWRYAQDRAEEMQHVNPNKHTLSCDHHPSCEEDWLVAVVVLRGWSNLKPNISKLRLITPKAFIFGCFSETSESEFPIDSVHICYSHVFIAYIIFILQHIFFSDVQSHQRKHIYVSIPTDHLFSNYSSTMSSTAKDDADEIPLLANELLDVYSRFTFREKQFILLIVSFSGILTCEASRRNRRSLLFDLSLLDFAGGTFVPTIALVANDVGTSQEAIK
jgi:hypothetical protein